MADGGHHQRRPPRRTTPLTAKEQEAAVAARNAARTRAHELRDAIDLVLKHAASFNVEPWQERLLQTKCVLDIAPELYSAWNFRRRVLLAAMKRGDIHRQEALQIELKYTMELLKEHPKSYWLWNHRAWAMAGLGNVAPWAKELMLVDRMLTIDPRNFHGWDYRRHVVANLHATKATAEPQQPIPLAPTINEELMYTRSKIESSFSNYSAWHYRSRLLAQVAAEAHRIGQKTTLDDDKQRESVPIASQLYIDDLEFVMSAIATLPSDECPWLYLDFLLSDPPENYCEDSLFSNNSIRFDIDDPDTNKNSVPSNSEIVNRVHVPNPLAADVRQSRIKEIVEQLMELWEIEEVASLASGIVTLMDCFTRLNDFCKAPMKKVTWLSQTNFNSQRTKFIEYAEKLDPDRRGMYKAMREFPQ